MSIGPTKSITSVLDEQLRAELIGPAPKEEKKFHGTPASNNVAIAPPQYLDVRDLNVECMPISPNEVEYEIGLLEPAMNAAYAEIEESKKKTTDKQGLLILEAHETITRELVGHARTLIAHDPELKPPGPIAASWAITKLADKFKKIFSNSASPLIRERTVDVDEVKERLLRSILGINNTPALDLTKQSIIVTERFRPSFAIAADPKIVTGACAQYGGLDDHTAIMFRRKKIPYIIGVEAASLMELTAAELVAMDGTTGEVYADPTEDTMLDLQTRPSISDFVLVNTPLVPQSDSPEAFNAKSMDGTDFSISLNVSDWNEAANFVKLKSSGVGLYRSELMGEREKSYPSASEQSAQMAIVVVAMNPKPIRFRTLDIGGDKVPDWYKHSKNAFPEKYPDMKGLRLSLYDEYNLDLFRRNIEGILLASKYGTKDPQSGYSNVEIMFPEVLDAEQFEEALLQIATAKKNINFDDSRYKIRIGAMIENPIALEGLEHIVARADFISIGSNDLKWGYLQMRRHKNIAKQLAKEDQPGLYRAIKKIVEECNRQEKPVCICGDFASDPLKIPMLIGCGLRNLSVFPECALEVNTMLSICNVDECKKLVEDVINSPGPKAAAVIMEAFLKVLEERAKERKLVAKS